MACHDLIMKRLLIRARGSRFYFGHLVLIIIIQLYFLLSVSSTDQRLNKDMGLSAQR